MAEYLAQFPNFHIHNFERLFLYFCPKLFDGKGKNAIQQQIACHQRLSQYGSKLYEIYHFQLN